MRRRLAAACCAALLAAVPALAADDPLARARSFYNQRQFEAAIVAADQARVVPAKADAADLVAARALLERYRVSGTAEDLINGRDRLRRLDPQKLPSRERVEYHVGLGAALFFDGAFGAAGQVFDTLLIAPAQTPSDQASRERVLDWWATALDREAKPRPEIERQTTYQRIRERMEQEIAARPSSTAAAYWLAAAAQAQGDLQSAWSAAQAGWVRAPLAADRGTALRADLDRLVLRAIVPDRARILGQPADTLRLQWEQFKERWTR